MTTPHWTILLATLALCGCGSDGGDGGGGDEPTRISPIAIPPPSIGSPPVTTDSPPAPTPTAPPVAPPVEPPDAEPEPESPPPPEDDPDTSADGGIPLAFRGVWQSDCSVFDGFGIRQLIFLEPDRVASGSIVHFDTNCATPQLETRIDTTIVFGDPSTLADGSEAFAADVTAPGDVVTIPLNTTAAAQLTLERVCDITNWAANVEFDTSDCPLVTDDIEQLFRRTARQIYSVQDETLFVGLFVSTPSVPVPLVRPSALNYANPYRRIER